mgnify:FL=1
MTLIEHLKAAKAKKVTKVTGPNGAFLSIVGKDDKVFTMPVGKKSQEGAIADYNVLISEDGQAIATINNCNDEESMEL